MIYKFRSLVLFFLLVLFVSTFSQSTNVYNDAINKIESILIENNIKNSKYGISIYSLDKNQLVYERNGNTLLTPASNTKTFTTFSAFTTFSSDYQIPTVVYTDGAIKGDVLNGNLYLVGYGDAYLKITDLEILAEELSHMGIKSINGNIYGVGSYYDNVQQRQNYAGDKDEVEPVSPISALSIEKNQVTVLVKSGSIPGSKVDVQLIPNCDAFIKNINATVRTVSLKKSRKSKVSKLVSNQSPIKVISNFNNGNQYFSIKGNVQPNQTLYYRFHNYLPELSAANVFKQRLTSFGIKVHGHVNTKYVSLHPDSILNFKELTKITHPMKDIIKELNKESDNYLAENIFKMIGGKKGNNKNTAEAARNEIRKVMSDNKIEFDNCQLNDGCGLSRRNLITSSALMEMLKVAYRKPFYEDFYNSLSIAGVDGTLIKRLKNTYAYNNLHAKTGTLGNVSSLAGYVRARNGELFAFAYVFNGPSVGLYKCIENDISTVLSEINYLRETNNSNNEQNK